MRFTPGELKIMRLLWDHGELKPAEIQDGFPHEIKNSALRSYLTILLDKGHVERRKEGKAYVYRAVTKRKNAFSAMLNQVVEVFCEGSTQNLLLNLVKSEKLSEEDIEKIKAIVDSKTESAESQISRKPKPKSSKATKKKPSRRSRKRGSK